MYTEHWDQATICPLTLREVSVLAELALGHLRYFLTGVPYIYIYMWVNKN